MIYKIADICLPVCVMLLFTNAFSNELDWQTIPAPPRLAEIVSLYRLHETAWDFSRGLGDWNARHNEQTVNAKVTTVSAKADAPASLVVEYEYPPQKGRFGYLDVGCSLKVPRSGLGLMFRIKFEEGFLPDAMRIRLVDKSGETFQYLMSTQPSGSGWWNCITAFDRRGYGTGSWGGDGNNKLDYPVKLHSIIVERPRGEFPRSGRLLVNGLRWVSQREEELTVHTSGKRLGNLYAPGERLRFRARGEGQTIRWRLEDYYGSIHARGEGSAESCLVDCSMPALGWFALIFESLAALPPGLTSMVNGAIGTNTHFNESWKKPLTVLELLPRYGMRHIRDHLLWSCVESNPGEYAVTEHQKQFLKQAKELGLSTLFILCYGNPYYESSSWPTTEESYSAFGRYAAYLVNNYGHQISGVEVWNEYYAGCGMGSFQKFNPAKMPTPERYARMIIAVHQAVKTVDQDCLVMGLGGEFVEYIDRCEESMRLAPAAFDGITTHPYHSASILEDADAPDRISIRQVVGKFLAAANRQGVPERLWATEYGYSAQMALADHMDYYQQAVNDVRATALLLSTPGVERVYKYEFMDADPYARHEAFQFGMVMHHRDNCAPRPTGVALATLSRLTADRTAAYVRHGDIQSVCFTATDGSQSILIWSSGKPASFTIKGQVDGLTGLMGEDRDAVSTLTANAIPVWIRGKSLRIQAQRFR